MYDSLMKTKLQTRIFLFLGPFLAVVIIAVFILNYITIQKNLAVKAEKDLKNIHQNMYSSANALLHSSIVNYLRGITEKNLDLVHHYYNMYKGGTLTEAEAKDAIMEKMLLQKVGKTGYLVAVKASGDSLVLDLHPHMRGIACEESEGCQVWEQTRNGYCEYNWKNPLDNSFRKKVAYVQEFKPWNWIFGASSYKDEFIDLVDIDDLKKLIKPITINGSGYFFLFDETNNKMLIHPELEGEKDSKLQTEEGENFIAMIRKDDDGYLTYSWKNPSEEIYRQKYAYIKKLEDYNWYLGASGYIDEINEPIKKFKFISIWVAIISSIALIIFVSFFSRRVLVPLNLITDGVRRFNKTKDTFTWNEEDVVEIDYLGKKFSSMTLDLKKYMDNLQSKIHELDDSQKEKSELAGFLTNVINSMPSIVVCVSNELKITHWNLKAEIETGKSAEEVYEQTLCTTLPLIAQKCEEIRSSIDQKRVYKFSITDRQNESEEAHYDITTYPLSGKGKTAAVIRIDDVTERVKLEESLSQNQKMEAIGQLAGGVAHDFNNMLTGILSSVENLENNVKENSNKRSLEIIKNAALRTRDLTKNLLDFSRQNNSPQRPFSIHDTIKDTIHILKHSIKKSTTLNTELGAPKDTVVGDVSKIQNMLLNMGINSDHAMENGGTLKYKTSILTNDLEKSTAIEMIRIEIMDTGCGIPEKVIDKIFNPFFTTKKQGEGTGLGLASTYAIVKQHFGRINVKSIVDEGTVFTIDLPLVENVEIKKEEKSDILSINGRTILIIDDEEMLLEAASQMVERLGAKVITAQNGEEGLKKYTDRMDEIDLVLLDMRMPLMDGPECFYKLKEINPEVRVVVSSGFSKEGTVEKMEESGLSGFVNKPYRKVELHSALSSVLNN